MSTTTVTQVWKMIQAIVPHQLLLKRNAAAFHDTDDSIHAVAATIWATVVHQVEGLAAAKRASGVSYNQGRLLSKLVRALQADNQTEQRSPREARLYYDGGARGNPGPSGAGSLLVERANNTEDWTIVWWASTYLGNTHTNNVAEHTALAQGITEAARRYGRTTTHTTIIGDSLLATRQPKNQIQVRCTDTSLSPRPRRPLRLHVPPLTADQEHRRRLASECSDERASHNEQQLSYHPYLPDNDDIAPTAGQFRHPTRMDPAGQPRHHRHDHRSRGRAQVPTHAPPETTTTDRHDDHRPPPRAPPTPS